MNLRQIPKSDVVLVDANIILYAARGVSTQCEQLLTRCSERDISCIIPSAQFAEVMHRLLVAEARDNGWVGGSNPTKQLSERPERIRSLFRYEQQLRNLLGAGLVLEPIIREDFVTAISLQRQFGLMTNDALLAACAGRLGIQSLASADKTFSQVRGVILYSPDDLQE
jgi:predicted nucleic acid-binding protein